MSAGPVALFRDAEAEKVIDQAKADVATVFAVRTTDKQKAQTLIRAKNQIGQFLKSATDLTVDTRHQVEGLELEYGIKSLAYEDVEPEEKANSYEKIFDENDNHPDAQALTCVGLLKQSPDDALNASPTDKTRRNVEAVALIGLQKAVEPNTAAEMYFEVGRLIPRSQAKIDCLLQGAKYATTPALKAKYHLAIHDAVLRSPVNPVEEVLNKASASMALARKFTADEHKANQKLVPDDHPHHDQIVTRMSENLQTQLMAIGNKAALMEKLTAPLEELGRLKPAAKPTEKAVLEGLRYIFDPPTGDELKSTIDKLSRFVAREEAPTVEIAMSLMGLYFLSPASHKPAYATSVERALTELSGTPHGRAFLATEEGVHFHLAAATIMAERDQSRIAAEAEALNAKSVASQSARSSVTNPDRLPYRDSNPCFDGLQTAMRGFAVGDRRFGGDLLAKAASVLADYGTDDTGVAQCLKIASEEASAPAAVGLMSASEAKRNIGLIEHRANDYERMKKDYIKLAENKPSGVSPSDAKKTYEAYQDALVSDLHSNTKAYVYSADEDIQLAAAARLSETAETLRNLWIDNLSIAKTVIETKSGKTRVDAADPVHKSKQSNRADMSGAMAGLSMDNNDNKFKTEKLTLEEAVEIAHNVDPVKRQAVQLEAERQRNLNAFVGLCKTPYEKAEAQLALRKAVSPKDIGARWTSREILKAQKAELAATIDQNAPPASQTQQKSKDMLSRIAFECGDALESINLRNRTPRLSAAVDYMEAVKWATPNRKKDFGKNPVVADALARLSVFFDSKNAPKTDGITDKLSDDDLRDFRDYLTEAEEKANIQLPRKLTSAPFDNATISKRLELLEKSYG